MFTQLSGAEKGKKQVAEIAQALDGLLFEPSEGGEESM